LTIPLKTTKKGAAAPFLGFSPGLVLCGNCFRLSKRATDAFLLSWRGSRNTLRLFRLPYVKYSTGANKAICTAYRALGKPDSTAARRAFLAGRIIGEWHAESKCLFRREALFRSPASLFCILFSDKPEKSMPPEASGASERSVPHRHKSSAIPAQKP